jgi:hypothetical protein
MNLFSNYERTFEKSLSFLEEKDIELYLQLNNKKERKLTEIGLLKILKK